MHPQGGCRLNPAHKKKGRKSEAAGPLLFRPRIHSAELSRVLQRVARAMSPFYRLIAGNRLYAKRWSRAVVAADLARMERLLRLASPVAARQGLASNGIGYFVTFAAPAPVDNYLNGVSIPPGSVQFFFETRAHRWVARHVVPFYETLAQNKSYAGRLSRAILRRDADAAGRLIRARIRTPHLRSVAVEDDGVVLTFAFPFSRHPYQNVLCREIIKPDGRDE